MYTVMKYIHEHTYDKMSVDDVARHFGYSKWYFCTLFKRFTGRSFVEYCKHYRMQLAAIDILNGEKTIDVAFKYGYDTQGGFNKAFLCEYGCLPRAFKQKNKLFHIRYKERRDKLYKLSDRCEILRDMAVAHKELSMKICAQRHFLYNEGIMNFEGQTGNDALIAAGIANVINKSPAIIYSGELIVGYNYGDGIYGDCWLAGNNSGDRNILDSNQFTEEQINNYFNTRGHINDKLESAKKPTFSKQDQELTEEWSAIGRCISSNHTVLGYKEVLTLGFEGILEKVKHYEEINGPSDLYRGMKILCEAACHFGDKYAVKAKELLCEPDLTDERKSELKKMAIVCSNVPGKPAASLWEAIQSLWFAHIINTWEDGINANSLGRLDQILYPYYLSDIEKGVITKEEAFELICCLWIKLYRDYDVQQSCIGGCLPDGSSAVNELSYMMLDATERLDFIRCLSVRFSAATDKQFLRRALEVVGHVQKGIPFFFNDDVMIPALMGKGISLEDARDYTQIGCVETVIPGKSNPHAVSGETNLLKALEYALNDGKSMINDTKNPGIKTGDIKQLDSYDKLKAAVFRQIRHILDSTCRKIVLHTKTAETNDVKPYKSLLTQGCMERNLDFNRHGATYDYYQVMLGGIPNLADSLMSLKTFVFDNPKYTFEEVVSQLKNDYPDETIRLYFLNKSPKYGNDLDEVDSIAVEITNYACDCLDELSEKYGFSFHAQLFTFIWMVNHGHNTAATPDGRHKGEIIAYSVSPMQGRDFNGLTALLNSLTKLPTKRIPGTASAIVEVDPKLFTDNNIDCFVAMLLTSAEKGLSNIQFNITDADTLIEAQKFPEKFKNLSVRVSGFSQKFNLVGKELQDHIIGRTKHKCL